MTTKTLPDLSQFYGTENIYKNIFGFRYTDGIKFLAEECGAYWLIDLVASYQPKLRKKSQRLGEFQLWTLKVNGSKAVAVCQEDSDTPNVVSQRIPYTDFPETISFYVCDGTMMLKSER